MFDKVLIGSDYGPDGGEAMAFAHLLAAPDAAFTLTGMRDQSVLEIAEAEAADLIVLASRHDGAVGRIALQHEAGVVVDGARCAVAITPAGYRAPCALTRIGIGHNGSPEAIRGLAVARTLARRQECEISALATVSLASIPIGEPVPERWPDAAADLIEAEQARLSTFEGVTGTARYGHPGEELAIFSHDLDLLIVGSRGLDRIGRWRAGSTSRYLISHATCPLLVIGRQTVVSTRERPQPPVPAR